jgi:hypothetical protein
MPTTYAVRPNILHHKSIMTKECALKAQLCPQITPRLLSVVLK